MLQDAPTYNDEVRRLFPQYMENGEHKRIVSYTFQVTEDCSLRCKYCYQPTKVKKYMTFDVAKKAIDQMLYYAENDKESLLHYSVCQGVVIEFIGGEPLLNIDLVLQIIEYFEQQLMEHNSPWVYFHKYSFSSNGVAFFEPKVQEMMKKYSNLISMGITVDGNKELHDSCRVFPDGSGSYDYAIKAALYLKEKYNEQGTKITIAPGNLPYLKDAIINMINMGFIYVHANIVFENVWTLDDAKLYYQQLKSLTDYLFENDMDDKCYIALFNDNYFNHYTFSHNMNWCGGTGAMVAVDCDGNYYPCIRYLPNSVGFAQKPYTIGNLEDGLYQTPKDKATRDFLESITRTSQSTQECNDCPIGMGCAWCSGHNYQCFGTPNKRATYICQMHKARALGNLYFWKMDEKYHNRTNKFENCITDEIALEIISKEEWEFLKSL